MRDCAPESARRSEPANSSDPLIRAQPRGWQPFSPTSTRTGIATFVIGARCPPDRAPSRRIVHAILDFYRTKEEHASLPPAREFAMSAPSSLSDNSRYEQACDQAIAMCDGNLRSTIKALIMANEYLETELEELQAAIAAGCVPAKASHAEQRRRLKPDQSLERSTMADVTYYVALPFQQDDSGSPVAGAAEECQSSSMAPCGAPRSCRARPGKHRRGRVQPHRRSHDRRIRRCAIAAEIRQRAGRSERALASRHCERSEAIHRSDGRKEWIASSLRSSQ